MAASKGAMRMSGEIRFILDFDSTLVRVETLEVMAELKPDGAPLGARIKALTDAAMGGSLSFHAALEQRLKLLRFHRDQLPALAARLEQEISPSFLRNRAFLAAHADRIHVVTSGFREAAEPVLKSLGLDPKHLLANTLHYDADGYVDGCDWSNPLAQDGGKPKAVAALKLKGEVVAVGDGITDYEIFAAGAASRFYAYTENVKREAVLAKATKVAPSFDEVLYDCGLKAAVSYPKNRLKVLLVENIHPEAVAAF
ncbi:MAG TPA: HAD-IB family phosphatase, partial [Gammaproteobacteria bacterium]|nr:HAD-IB family phosphatase [Gammaproteobacteria bacterium]